MCFEEGRSVFRKGPKCMDEGPKRFFYPNGSEETEVIGAERVGAEVAEPRVFVVYRPQRCFVSCII